VPASASQADDYANAIHRALTLVQFAQGGDDASRQQALLVLEQLPGPAQPEIARDIRAQPPDLSDADQRLQALYNALQARVDTADPAAARRQLQQVLAMPRYAGLRAGPSLADQALGAIQNAVARLLQWLGVGGLHLNIPTWLWLLLALAAIGFIVFWPARGAWSRGGGRPRMRAAPAAIRHRIDFFADAEAMAARRDYDGAIRALAGGVAVRLRGEHVWDHSPLTVRELFEQSDRAVLLRPLLQSFEESSYGHRQADAQAYASAAAAAASYRGAAA
jgi:hypothetical protein